MKHVYIAIPYTGIEDSSYAQANLATALALQMGCNVFSPITHSHPLTKISGIAVPGTWEFWSVIDKEWILTWADEVWVLYPKEGDDFVYRSIGVSDEIAYATEVGKIVKFFRIIDNKIVFV